MRLAAAVMIVAASLQWAGRLHAQAVSFVQAPGSPITVGPGSGEVALADLNGDGHLDLISKHLLQQSIGVRFGDGRGDFGRRPAELLRLSYQPGAIALGDIDNDGILDLGIASREADREFVHVLRGNGQGRFMEVSGSPVGVSASFEFYKPILYLRDLNQDRKADIVTANGRRNRIHVLLGDGQGGFANPAAVSLEPDGDFYSFALADIDQDGQMDIVAADNGATGDARGRLHFKRGKGHGAFLDVAESMPPVLPDPRIGSLMDVNGDMHADIVVTHGRSRQIEVLLNDGRGRFTSAPAIYTVAGEANEVVVADVNADGRGDLVVATVNSVTVLLGTSGGFKPAPGSPFRAGPGAYRVTVGDVNSDQRPDLLASSFDGDAVTMLLGR
jgi:FG-GAP-like repeat